MLNEIKEFEEYTCDIKKETARRLKWGNIIGRDFQGVPRVLTVIARYAYYEGFASYDAEKKADAIVYLLNCWCGFEDYPGENKEDREEFDELIGKTPKLKHVRGWLPGYIIQLAADNGKTTKIDKKLETLKNEKKKSWNRSPFLDNIEDHAISFKGIVADAINEGPLKERYLMLKKHPMEDAVGCGKVSENDMYDKWLKTLAAVIMGKAEGSKYADVNYPDLANWIVSGVSEGGKIDERIIDKMKYNIGNRKGVNIVNISRFNPEKKDEKYLWLDPEWEKEYAPEIVESSFCLPDNDRYVYKDEGSGKPLGKLKK